MGLIDTLGQSVLNQVVGKLTGNQSGLLQSVIGSLLRGGSGGSSGGTGGGLGALVEQFQKAGMGDLINSWIGTGANKTITPEQVQQGLGHEKLKEIAEQAGCSGEEASTGLAALLPELIDKLTPEGSVPEGGMMDKALDYLKGRLAS